MQAFMAQHRYAGRRTADDLLERLRRAPTGLAGDAEADAPRASRDARPCRDGSSALRSMGELVRALVRSLTAIVEAIAELTSRIEHAVVDLPDGQIVMSFPRAGRINAAQILAELGNVRTRFQTGWTAPLSNQLAAEAGVCPVTHASGKSRGVVFRFACNHRLRAAVTCWADNSRHASAWAAATYAKARGRGCDHPHAIRILARAWLRVLWRAWFDRKAYRPQLHLGAIKLAA